MKIQGVLGDHAFHALLKNGNGWKVTNEVYFTQQEVMKFNEGYEMIWPIEIREDGCIYVPAQEELE